MMLKRSSKTGFQSDETLEDVDDSAEAGSSGRRLLDFVGGPFKDYFKFIFYCILLAVPLYAITMSILRQDWIMVIIDALLVPVGFIHGLLLLLGYVS